MTDSINPATGALLASYPFLSDAEIEAALARARRASGPWAATSFVTRGEILRSIATWLRRERDEIARLITLEMGKPITEAEAEIEKSAWNCEYVAEHAQAWLADVNVPTNATSSYVSHLPLGTVLAILPWNFPVWQIFRCAASALMAGNTLVLKHAPNVAGCAEFVTQLLHRAGLPQGVFENLHVSVPNIARIIADPRIAAVTLTGSAAAGAAVAAQAGAACKKTLMELGGSDPFIVLEDADLDAAVAAGIRARFTNCGQVCLAAKRFIVAESIAGQFETKLAEAAARLRRGDPLDRTTQLGPLARNDLRAGLERQVSQSLGRGARLLVGGRAPAGPGFFYEPTVLTNVDASMAVFHEETFGPVAAITYARDAADAEAIANDSAYGLAAIIWSRDIDAARGMARRLVTGSVFINGVTASDPRLPVGGVKLSGYGRELGAAGMRELVNLQSVWIGPAKP
ncbi:MAG: aldehyde dehydrogenase family protein [Steroidobacteraceae bacterium]